MPDPSPDDDDPFFVYIRPYLDSLIELIDASLELRAPHPATPAADSKAMAEVAAEAARGIAIEPTPLAETYMLAPLMISSAEDHFRSIPRLFEREPVASYAHWTLIRAGAETAARAAWLLEGGIGVDERMARGFTERMASLREQYRFERLHSEQARARFDERSARLAAQAEEVGIPVGIPSKDRPIVFGNPRPTPRQVLDGLFGNDLGSTVWAVASAVAHGTVYALYEALEDAVPDPMRPGVAAGRITTRPEHVATFSHIAALAEISVVSRWSKLMGWRTDRWVEAMKGVFALGTPQVVLRSKLREAIEIADGDDA